MSKCFCCGAKYVSGKANGCVEGCYSPFCISCKLCVNHCRCREPRYEYNPSSVVERERREAKKEAQ